MTRLTLLLLSGSLFAAISMAIAGLVSKDKTDSMRGAIIYALFQATTSALAILVIMKYAPY